MKIIVPILLSLTGVLSQQAWTRHVREIPMQRRQFVSYSNQVIHQNPNYPDQTAESSVKVSFNPNNVDTHQQAISSPQTNYQPRYQTIKQSYQQPQQQHQQQELHQQELHQQQQTYNKPTLQSLQANQNYRQQPIQSSNYDGNVPQSQLFNVGYSVKFTNGQNQQQQVQQSRPIPQQVKYSSPQRPKSLDDGEVITGRAKQNEEVRAPNMDLSPQDFVSTALLDNKKQKISGYKSKAKLASGNYPNPKTLLSQANLSPKTQNYYKAIEQAKPQLSNSQEVQQKYSWRHLSPGVEIIKSTEIPAVHRLATQRGEQQGFDHARALGKSQDFDYTNALESQQPQEQFYRQKPSPQITRQSYPVQSQFPIDMSLLREKPVLTTSEIKSSDPNVLPIRVDTRLLEAMKAQLAQQQYPIGQYVQQQPDEQQQEQYPSYHTIQEQNYQETQQQPQQPTQGFQDYQSQQSRYQYKIYGKPQPIGTIYPKTSERQPRYVKPQVNMRPPPFMNYQRRVYLKF